MTEKITLNNGIKIPAIGLGVWKLAPEACYRAVRTALACGYRHIDTARIYGNEEAVGQAVRESGIDRQEIFVTTKLWNTDQKDPRGAFEKSLQKLGLDYIDLYLIHFPVSETRIAAYRAIEQMYHEKLTRSIGVSNFMIAHLKELLQQCDIPPAVNQFEFHPWLYQKELLDFCQQNNIVVEAYSPLAHGQKLQDHRLLDIAKSVGRTPAQVLIRWSLQKGCVVLPKSGNDDRIRENFQVWDFSLGADTMSALDSLNENLRTCWDPSGTP